MKEKNEVVDEILEEAGEAVADPVVEELKATKEQLLRLAAEFDNFRKRSLKERDEISLRTKCDVMKAFLPVMDNFDRALEVLQGEAASAPQAAKGVKMIFEQFSSVMESLGAKEVSAVVGEPFNPELHHAVGHKEDADLKECVIDEVYSKGYTVDSKLVREATVITRG